MKKPGMLEKSVIPCTLSHSIKLDTAPSRFAVAQCGSLVFPVEQLPAISTMNHVVRVENFILGMGDTDGAKTD